MTDDERYLKETLNQVCKNAECLYEFFINNVIASDYHRIRSLFGTSLATFLFENSYVAITQCPKSYKVGLAYTTCEMIRCESFKLIGKYI